MNNYLYVLFLCVIQYSFAQENVYLLDVNGNRHGLWVKTYENGSIRYKGTFEHGKEVGKFEFYTENNVTFPECIKEFALNSNQVKVSYYYPDGKLKSSGQMLDHQRVGKWIYFFKDGNKVLSEENYKNGLLEGDYKIFYINGKLTEWSMYKNGLLHGVSKRYAENDILIEEINYSEGKLNGPALYYNTSGELILKGTYLNDISVGAWESYENGILKETFYPNKKKD